MQSFELETKFKTLAAHQLIVSVTSQRFKTLAGHQLIVSVTSQNLLHAESKWCSQIDIDIVTRLNNSIMLVGEYIVLKCHNMEPI